jgi:arginine/lysine/histidine transport system permease protein
MIDLALLKESMPYLLRGALVTLQIASISCAIGLVLGTLCGLGLASKNKFVRLLISVYTALFRGTPMLIQIIFAALVLPTLGIGVSRFWGVIWAIALNSSAYIAHIIKSGINSVSQGQREAGKTLGLSNLQIVWYIVLPQAIRVVWPALGNEFITLIKDSSLASIVGIQELTKEGEIISSRTLDALTIYLGVAATYLVITTALSLLISFIEQRMNHHAQL